MEDTEMPPKMEDDLFDDDESNKSLFDDEEEDTTKQHQSMDITFEEEEEYKRGYQEMTALMSYGADDDAIGDAVQDEEVNAITKYLWHRNVPSPNKRYITVRLPSVVSLSDIPSSTACTEDTADVEANNKDTQPSPIYTIDWHPTRYEDGAVDAVANNYTSNTKLVEWEDGSYTLFVGGQPFDCEHRRDVTYLFECSQELKPLHLIVEERFQIREANFNQNSTTRFKKMNVIKQRTKLTTPKEAESLQLMTKKALENRRDLDRMRRRQNDASKEVGLTGTFLEEDSDE